MTTQETLLVALRGRFGDSQTAIADATGMSLGRVNNYIRDTRKMDDDAVIACCELLGWNPQKYVAAHRAEIASTKREATFWKRVSSAAAVMLLISATLPAATPARASQGHAYAATDTVQTHGNRHYAKYQLLATDESA